MPATDGIALPKRRIRPVLTEEQKAVKTARLHSRGFKGGNMPVCQEAQARKRAAKVGILDRVQGLNILDFAKEVGFSFERRYGQELVLRLLHGLPLPEGRIVVYVRKPCDGFVLEEREVTWLEYYRMLTGNKDLFEKGQEPTEAYLCVGARSGKSTITSLEACWQATRGRWLAYLRKHETAYAGIIATNVEQARDLIQQNCHDMLFNSPLQSLIADSGKRQIKLTNGLGIRSFPCNTRAPRGFPYFFTCYDEAAWYYAEGAKADENVHAAMNPRRLQFPGSKHMSITTPAGKQGLFYKIFSQGSQIHRRLVVKAPTWLFRPELVETGMELLQHDFLGDPFHFNREYGAEFDEVCQAFLPQKETSECLLLPGDVPFNPNIRYFMGIDASGLSGNDQYGMGVAGKDTDRNRLVVSAVRSWPDRNPDPIMAELEEIAKRYRIRYAFTDAYAKGWVHSALKKIGIEPVLCPAAAVVWMNFRALILAKKVDMPDTESLRTGLMSTQGSYSSSSRLLVTRHRDKHGHGDEAEGVSRAVYGASQETYYGSRETEEDKMEQDRLRRQEAEYDPLAIPT